MPSLWMSSHGDQPLDKQLMPFDLVVLRNTPHMHARVSKRSCRQRKFWAIAGPARLHSVAWCLGEFPQVTFGCIATVTCPISLKGSFWSGHCLLPLDASIGRRQRHQGGRGFMGGNYFPECRLTGVHYNGKVFSSGTGCSMCMYEALRANRMHGRLRILFLMFFRFSRDSFSLSATKAQPY